MTDKKQAEELEKMKLINKELDERIAEANKDTSKIKWRDLLPKLMDVEIYAAGSIMEPVSGKKELSLASMDFRGRKIIPFFTNPIYMADLIKKSGFSVLKFKTAYFFGMVKDAATVMNPNSQRDENGNTLARVFTPFEMKVLSAEYFAENPEKAEKSEKSE